MLRACECQSIVSQPFVSATHRSMYLFGVIFLSAKDDFHTLQVALSRVSLSVFLVFLCPVHCFSLVRVVCLHSLLRSLRTWGCIGVPKVIVWVGGVRGRADLLPACPNVLGTNFFLY